MDPDEEAQLLLAHHGKRAQQVVIDALVEAIKARDEATIAQRSAILRAIDRSLQEAEDDDRPVRSTTFYKTVVS